MPCLFRKKRRKKLLQKACLSWDDDDVLLFPLLWLRNELKTACGVCGSVCRRAFAEQAWSAATGWGLLGGTHPTTVPAWIGSVSTPFYLGYILLCPHGDLLTLVPHALWSRPLYDTDHLALWCCSLSDPPHIRLTPSKKNKRLKSLSRVYNNAQLIT